MHAAVEKESRCWVGEVRESQKERAEGMCGSQETTKEISSLSFKALLSGNGERKPAQSCSMQTKQLNFKKPVVGWVLKIYHHLKISNNKNTSFFCSDVVKRLENMSVSSSKNYFAHLLLIRHGCTTQHSGGRVTLVLLHTNCSLGVVKISCTGYPLKSSSLVSCLSSLFQRNAYCAASSACFVFACRKIQILLKQWCSVYWLNEIKTVLCNLYRMLLLARLFPVTFAEVDFQYNDVNVSYCQESRIVLKGGERHKKSIVLWLSPSKKGFEYCCLYHIYNHVKATQYIMTETVNLAFMLFF